MTKFNEALTMSLHILIEKGPLMLYKCKLLVGSLAQDYKSVKQLSIIVTNTFKRSDLQQWPTKSK